MVGPKLPILWAGPSPGCGEAVEFRKVTDGATVGGGAGFSVAGATR